MQYKFYVALSGVLIATALLFSHCKKGDVGPAGPAGPAGASGFPGTKGDTGTANVIYSAWLDVPFIADTIHLGAVIDTIGFSATISVSKLSNAIISNGEMKVYMNVGTSANPDVFILPYFDVYSGISVVPEFFVQKIKFYSNANVGTVTRNGSKYFQYRYILIPGSVTGRIMYPVDWGKYGQVKDFLDLKD